MTIAADAPRGGVVEEIDGVTIQYSNLKAYHPSL